MHLKYLLTVIMQNYLILATYWCIYTKVNQVILVDTLNSLNS